MVLRALSIVLCVWLIASTSRAQSVEPRPSLSWVRMPGAESCPSAQELARAVEQAMTHAPFAAAGEADRVLEARVAPAAGGGFDAVVRLADASGAILGERSLSSASSSCAEMLPELAFVIGMLIDPEAALAPVEEPEEPQPIIEPPPPARAPEWRLEVDLSAGLALGLAPFVSASGALALVVEPPGFVPLIAHGALVPWSRAELSGASGDVLLVYAGLAICPLSLADSDRRLRACIGLDAGGTFVVATRALDPRERERVTGYLDARVTGVQRIAGPVSVVLSLVLLVPFRQERWSGASAGTELAWWSHEPVAGTLELGVAISTD